MTVIYLIRHGQASFGQKNYDQLSVKGEMQSKVLGQYLSQIINSTPLVISGSMRRHQQTANLALQQCSQLNMHIDPTWNEFDHQQVFALYNARFADPELIKQDIITAENPQTFMMEIFTEAMLRWMNAEFDHQYTESWSGFKLRVDQALTNLSQLLNQHQSRHVAIFSSGGVIALVIAKLLNLDFNQTTDLIWQISNASITTLKFVDQRFELLKMNEYHYLEQVDEQLATWV